MDDWWDTIERDLLASLDGHGAMAPDEVGRQLGLSERAVVSLLALLAGEGKVRICLVEATVTAEGRRPAGSHEHRSDRAAVGAPRSRTSRDRAARLSRPA